MIDGQRTKQKEEGPMECLICVNGFHMLSLCSHTTGRRGHGATPADRTQSGVPWMSVGQYVAAAIDHFCTSTFTAVVLSNHQLYPPTAQHTTDCSWMIMSNAPIIYISFLAISGQLGARCSTLLCAFSDISFFYKLTVECGAERAM